MANDRTRLYLIETGEPLEAFYVDAKELMATGLYSTEPIEVASNSDSDDVPNVPGLDREAIKAELTALAVNFNKSAPTDKLQELLNDAKAAAGQQ